MNNDGTENLIDRATRALVAHGLSVHPKQGHKTGTLIQIDTGPSESGKRHPVDFLVQVVRRVTSATIGAALSQLRIGSAEDPPTLFVSDYFTPAVAEGLRVLEQPFADAAGNAYLTGPGLFVYVTGRKLEQSVPQARASKTFTPAGLKTLFALICDPSLADAPYRSIAAAANVALGSVPAVIDDLRGAGHLLTAGKRRRLNMTKRLIDEWALAYARTLRPKTLRGQYSLDAFDAWTQWQLDPTEALWGGEPAAFLLTHYLKPGILTIYAAKLPPKFMIEQRLVPARGPNDAYRLEVRAPFWGQTLRVANAERADIVAPILVYADLLATGDGRCIETARMIYDGSLARSFPAS